MSKTKRLILASLIAGAAAFTAGTADAFWGPFGGWGGPWGGGPWGGGPWGGGPWGGGPWGGGPWGGGPWGGGPWGGWW